MKILEKITKLRLERNWTEYRLSIESGVPQTTINSWYKKGIYPTISSLASICEAFNMTLCQFFSEENDEIDLTIKQRALLEAFNRLSQSSQEDLINFLNKLG